MNKRNTIIFSVLAGLVLIMVIGVLINEKNKKTEKVDETVDISEYTKKIEQLEKDLKTEQTLREYNENLLEKREKEIKKIQEIIININSTDSKYKETVEDVLEKYFKYSFSGTPYCGEHSADLETINDETILNGSYSGGYVKSYTFKNIEEVKAFYKTFLSDNYFNNNKKIYYVEKDNELYCYNIGKAGLKYEPNGSELKIILSKENTIEVYCTIKAYQLNELIQVEGLATLIKENNNWVVDEYIGFN